MPHSASAQNSAAPTSSTRLHSVENRWAAVALIAASTFIVVAAEMMPVGLLTPIGASLVESEGTIGLSLAITGLVAAATAPFVPVVTRRFDRRSTLVVLMLLVAAANALTALAPSFAVLAVARVVLGVSMGGVWALAASLAPKLVETRSVGLATTIIFSGIAVASVLGVPAGTYIGAAAGWSVAFWALSCAATLIALAMIAVLPTMPADQALSLGSLVEAFRNPGVRVGIAITALLITAHFAAYTYVRPGLEFFAGLNPSQVGTMLLIYGALGVVGNFIAGPSAAKSPKMVVVILSVGIAATLALFPISADALIAAALLMAAWGLFYGGVSVSTQTWIAHAAPAHREAASALWVAVFNASIALGAFAGGRIHDDGGSQSLFWISAGIAALAIFLATIRKPVVADMN
ncbi:MFS transporter [Rhodococcus sp. IEGM 1409]|uniref:MFS transporter n=1 Tax=Rhodococcus sp. IEGM 1409 TaxID=3047082 RepID=UPI0024B72AD9|nr:MFS transporter [Rhodococcus sp. IEGM 1409]MDI9902669.1 MFS transporter [Rhodococcus sp. IEGM 1409]